MRVVAFNGSPREDGNTGILLRYVLREIETAGIETELVQVDTEWVQRFHAILDIVREAILIGSVLLGTAIIVIIGNTIRLGEVKVKINAETKPCELMDQIHSGLREALGPDCRAGVYGQILEGGVIKVGDSLQVC